MMNGGESNSRKKEDIKAKIASNMKSPYNYQPLFIGY